MLAALPRVPSHLGMVPVHTCFRRPRGGLQLYGGAEHGQGKSRLLPMMVCFSAGVRHQHKGARLAACEGRAWPDSLVVVVCRQDVLDPLDVA